MKILEGKRIPIKSWCPNIEVGAMEQSYNLSGLPFAFKHIALMPDCHQGYGMPIGGVMATKNVIIPNAVGVDIGCGMCSIETNIEYNKSFKSLLPKIVELIHKRIPVGFFHNETQIDKTYMPSTEDVFKFNSIVKNEFERARYQIGTLGGGNHFIEIQTDTNNKVWIMIHSGSRNLGKKVADFYNKEAKKENELWHSNIEKSMDLAFIPFNNDLAREYFVEMNYCVEFALVNRSIIMSKVKNIFNEIIGNIQFSDMINIAHNYAVWENHFNKNVIIHRKGATRAYINEIGIIPGSQGSNSYIVKGLGNEQSFKSCSHGAGRKMGRKQAKITLDLKTELDKMDGIIHGITEINDLDEAPGSYKDIHEIMDNQKDLVEIVTELTPIAVIKG